MQTLLQEQSLYPESNIINFRIDESIAKSKIQFQIKGESQFLDLKKCGGVGRKL